MTTKSMKLDSLILVLLKSVSQVLVLQESKSSRQNQARHKAQEISISKPWQPTSLKKLSLKLLILDTPPFNWDREILLTRSTSPGWRREPGMSGMGFRCAATLHLTKSSS